MVTSNTNKPLGDQEYKGLSTDEKPTDCVNQFSDLLYRLLMVQI